MYFSRLKNFKIFELRIKLNQFIKNNIHYLRCNGYKK